MDPEILYSRVERNNACWAEITLNRPEKGNALNLPMLRRLADVFDRIHADRTLKAAVLRARGKIFSAGGDIEAWGALSPHDMGQQWILGGIDVLDRVASLPQPVIAVLAGHAIGGGLELAMAADLRIALRSVKLSVPEVTLGMISGWGGVRRLAEIIGEARARHMLLLGTPITAEQALDWGLITALADDPASLEEQLTAWLDRLCANSASAISLTKGILATLRADLRHHHASAAADASATEDCKEGVRAFLEKRKPVFR